MVSKGSFAEGRTVRTMSSDPPNLVGMQWSDVCGSELHEHEVRYQAGDFCKAHREG